jgi:hypothetical protein
MRSATTPISAIQGRRAGATALSSQRARRVEPARRAAAACGTPEKR